MAVELSKLYKEIYEDYEVDLLTESCFGKKISWVHVMEQPDFAYLLHGDELIFNSGLNDDSEERMQEFIDALLRVHAGGLVVARQERLFTDEIIAYCNAMRFPLFCASWETSFIDIMHRFSEIIISDERNETNLIAALKNAIYYPEDDKLYLSHFERNGYFQNMPYIITILGYQGDVPDQRAWKRIAKALQYALPRSLSYEEQGILVLLSAGHEREELEKSLKNLLAKEPGLYAGEGTIERRFRKLRHSYETGITAYEMAGSIVPESLVRYEDLGIYQILTDRREESIYPGFVKKTIGKLIDHDRINDTNYVEVLKAFFANECNMLQTASAMYFHRNTLKYKLNTIKDILGYDITENRHRVDIMLSLALLKMEAGKFGKTVDNQAWRSL